MKNQPAQAQRKRILDRACGLCEVCRSNGIGWGLRVHHIDPKGMGGSHHKYTDDELELLCLKCHDLRQGIKEGK